MEPSDNKLHLGCVGSIHATVTFQGRTAHSARPWEGENAITAAAAFLAKVGALRPVASVIDGLVYRSVTTVTQARDGGRGRNVVPDRFVVNVNHRFAPDRTLEEASAFVRGLVSADGAPVGAPGAAHVTVGAPGAAHATVELTDLSPAARPNAGHPLVKALVAAGVRTVEPKQAWTDVARFAQLATPVPAVNFGPGENAQAHQKNESTSLPLVHDGFAIVARWLASLGTPR
jgi:succinyl-diaminopimelate desuccinylase